MDDNLDKVAYEVRQCTKCILHLYRKNAVPGEGNPNAKIMFIGEAPGYNEDIQGRPFVGAAGKLLTQLIEEILNLKRNEVFITNIVKCRPPENRDPKEEEITACSQYLDRQIILIKPKIIVTLGRHSTSYILNKAGINFKGITSIRGKIIKVKLFNLNFTLIPTYHPAAVLYNPQLKEELIEDFKKIKEEYYKERKGLERFF
jgi:uracil-DNA glycosylase, family 4